MILHYDGSAWSHVLLDLREATSISYVCPAFSGIAGITGTVSSDSDIFIVGQYSTILRHCPGGQCSTN